MQSTLPLSSKILSSNHNHITKIKSSLLTISLLVLILKLYYIVGHTCNYAVVMAQLYTQGKCHGIHPFIVQLRDEDTWMPMPGKVLSN